MYVIGLLCVLRALVFCVCDWTFVCATCRVLYALILTFLFKHFNWSQGENTQSTGPSMKVTEPRTNESTMLNADWLSVI